VHRRTDLIKAAISWLLFLSALGGTAYLYRTRIPAPVSAHQAEAAPVPPPPPWRRELDAITAMEGDPVLVCGKLRNLLPALPPEGQVEAITHLVTLLPDGEYGTVQEIAAGSELPAAAWQILTSDALNRPNPAKLPVLVEVLRRSGEATRQQAKEELSAQLGSDYKEDWNAWSAAIARATGETAR
jgi:hypothetical protein